MESWRRGGLALLPLLSCAKPIVAFSVCAAESSSSAAQFEGAPSSAASRAAATLPAPRAARGELALIAESMVSKPCSCPCPSSSACGLMSFLKAATRCTSGELALPPHPPLPRAAEK